MIFASDNWTGASDRVAAALLEAAGGYAPAYGNDPLTASVQVAFTGIFEREVSAFFVATGTAAGRERGRGQGGAAGGRAIG